MHARWIVPSGFTSRGATAPASGCASRNAQSLGSASGATRVSEPRRQTFAPVASARPWFTAARVAAVRVVADEARGRELRRDDVGGAVRRGVVDDDRLDATRAAPAVEASRHSRRRSRVFHERTMTERSGGIG